MHSLDASPRAQLGAVPEQLNEQTRALASRADALGAQIAGLVERAGALATDGAGAAETRAAITAAARAAGVWPMTQPVSVGGTAASTLELTVVREALGRHNVGHLPGIFGPAPGLLAHADEPLRSDVLPRYLAGELRGSFGFTEPADALRHTWAVSDGDELIVNGAKSYVTGGADADFINTLVEVEGVGPAMVLIFSDTPGVELVRRFGTLDGSHHAAFTFIDVRVPAHNVLGGPADGLRRALGQVSAVRMAIAAQCVGQCAFVVDQLEAHLRAVEARSASAQPDRLASAARPAAESPQLRSVYGHARIATYAARSTLYRTARLVDAAHAAHAADQTNSDAAHAAHAADPTNSDAAAKTTANEVMATKAFATETLWALADQAISAIGGTALADDHPLSGVLRRARATRLAEGPTDVLAANIARGHLDLHLGHL